MKISVYSSTDSQLLNEFAEIVKKYSKNNIISITKHDKWEEDYYINFEADSLDFLPKLEQDLYNLNKTPYMLIFSTFEDETYGINIYYGYLD